MKQSLFFVSLFTLKFVQHIWVEVALAGGWLTNLLDRGFFFLGETFLQELSFLVLPQVPHLVFLILPLFLLVPSGNFPPAVPGLGRAHRCSSQGKEAPLGGVGFWGVAGSCIPVCPALCSNRDSMNTNFSCYSTWFSMRSNLRCHVKAWRNVWDLLLGAALPWDSAFNKVLDWGMSHLITPVITIPDSGTLNSHGNGASAIPIESGTDKWVIPGCNSWGSKLCCLWDTGELGCLWSCEEVAENPLPKA